MFQFQALPQLFGSSHLHFYLDIKGNISEMSDRWSFFYPSLAGEFSRAGHLRDYFDFPKRPLEKGETRVLGNKKAIFDLETPETLYASFPTFSLLLHLVEKTLYYGTLRFNGFFPNFYLQRPNGIIYLNREERLVGFNHTFYRFFSDQFKVPARMLNKPISLFLNPFPSKIEADRLATAGHPDTALMNKLYEMDTPRASATGDGLVFSNPSTNDFATMKVPVRVPAHRDFYFEMDFEVLSGFRPLVFLDKATEEKLPLTGGDYSLGTDVPGKNYQLKRRGVVQRICAQFPMAGKISWRFYRVGHTLVFTEQGERRLFFHDPNALHEEEALLRIALRDRSACRILSLRLYSAEKAAPPPSLPLTTLKIPAANAFIINPMDNVALSSGHPGILCYMLENATELHAKVDRLERENQRILAASGFQPDSMPGKSAAFSRAKETAAKAAASDVAILLQGETGTGKEVLANFIHQNSRRKAGPFVKVDCSTLPRHLIESELFGYERGAFTGAEERREGLLAQAGGGTLFLDEIENLSLEVQAKLLQFLQDHAFTPIGGRKAVSIDVRIIAASNTPVRELVKNKAFRPDLYYRMETVSITLPPLRERADDIPELCRHFIRYFNGRHEKKIRDFSAAAYEKLFAYPWPGNVRELRNVVERAVIFCDGEYVAPEQIALGAELPKGPSGRRGARPLKRVDATAMRALFQKHGGVALKVARELGVAPPSLYDKIAKLGLTVDVLRK